VGALRKLKLILEMSKKPNAYSALQRSWPATHQK